MIRGMNGAEWIMAAVVVMVSGLFFIAFFTDDPWADPHYASAPPIVDGVPSPHRGGREKMICSSCHEILPAGSTTTAQGIPPTFPGAIAPHPDGRATMPCESCHTVMTQAEVIRWYAQRGAVAKKQPKPQTATFAKVAAVVPAAPPPPPPLDPEAHERFRLTRFQGTVARSLEHQGGNVSALVENGVGKSMWYNLAPRPFLAVNGCEVGPGMFVKGISFTEGAPGEGMRYVKSLSVNGGMCDLRDDHMIGFWTGGAHADRE